MLSWLMALWAGSRQLDWPTTALFEVPRLADKDWLSAKLAVDQCVLLTKDFDSSTNKACRPIHSKTCLSANMDSAKRCSAMIASAKIHRTHNDTQHNDTHHMTFSITTLSTMTFSITQQCHIVNYKSTLNKVFAISKCFNFSKPFPTPGTRPPPYLKTGSWITCKLSTTVTSRRIVQSLKRNALSPSLKRHLDSW
jgi:hypothetical protein